MKTKLESIGSKVFWSTVFIITMLKYAYYGYSYYPLLDDNNMYGIFRLAQNVYRDVLLHYHMYTTRPVAVLLDAYFWAKFWNNLGATLLIMTVLHFLSCFFIYKVFEKSGMKLGLPTIIIYIFLPFGSEATYWLAASTRVVVGMFFLSLSLYLLCVYFEYQGYLKEQLILLSLFVFTHLISLGFYEQIIALSFFSLILLFVVKWKTLKAKWIISLPVINFGIIAFWYKIFSNQGNMAARGQVVSGNYLTHTKNVIRAIRDVWKSSFIDLYKIGFPDGMQTLLNNKSYFFLALIIAASIGLFFISRTVEFDKTFKVNILKFGLGLVLFVVPFSPFFAMELIWICNRNLFLSFIGLGLMAEAVLDVLGQSKALTVFRNSVITLVVFIFLVVNVYELTYYRNLGLIDNQVVTDISHTEGVREYLNKGNTLYLLNAKTSYVSSIAKRIENCTGSDWAVSGAIMAQDTSIKKGAIVPMPESANVSFDSSKIESYMFLGMDELHRVFLLKAVEEDGGRHYFVKPDGTEFGWLEFLEGNYAVFHLSQETVG